MLLAGRALGSQLVKLLGGGLRVTMQALPTTDRLIHQHIRHLIAHTISLMLESWPTSCEIVEILIKIPQ